MRWAYFSCRLVHFAPRPPCEAAPCGVPRSNGSDLFAQVAIRQRMTVAGPTYLSDTSHVLLNPAA